MGVAHALEYWKFLKCFIKSFFCEKMGVRFQNDFGSIAPGWPVTRSVLYWKPPQETALITSQMINIRVIKLSSANKRVFKGGLISESFSLWFHPPKNVPNHYPELFHPKKKCFGTLFVGCKNILRLSHLYINGIFIYKRKGRGGPRIDFGGSTVLTYYLYTI